MEYDVIIIGGGPAGYVAAIRAGQLGMKTVLVEKSSLGGMCLHWGCIPTKALMESARLFQKIKDAAAFGITGVDKKALEFDFKKARGRASRITTKLTKGIEFLQKKNNVEVIHGEAVIKDRHSISVEGRRLEAQNIILATGSRPDRPDNASESFVEIDSFLEMDSLPDSLGIYGEGPHVVELAQFLALIGKQVSFYTPGKEIVDNLDNSLKDFILKRLKKNKVNIVENSLLSFSEDGVILNNGEALSEQMVINGSRRSGIIPDRDISLEMNEGFLKVNDHFQTSIESIYAVGDVNGKSMLAHSASAQAIHAINHIKGIKSDYPENRIPLNMYTYPEMAQIGMTEQQAAAENLDYSVGEFPFSANGKALAEGQSDGFIRIISDNEFGEVIGVQIVSDHATDLISEAAALMELEGTVYDFANIVHAHPTVSEVFMESGADAFNSAIHK